MFAVQLRAKIEGASTTEALDHAVKALWSGYGANAVSEAETEALQDLANAKRLTLQAPRPATGPAPLAVLTRSIFPPRRYQRSPNRPRSIARRRHLASSGPMPPALASRFTTGQCAVFKVIADEVRERGTCTLTLGEIAARAGVCRSLAQEAIRQAERDCLLTVHRERPKGQRNKPNCIRVLSRDWFAWITRGPGRGGGFKKTDPTGSKDTQSFNEHAKRSRSRGFQREAAELGGPRSA
jgi:hypothetical protein